MGECEGAGHEAPDALHESDARFRAVFDSAGTGICVVSTEYRFLRVNDRFCEIVGYSAQELIEQHSCVDTTHVDDRAGDAEAVARLLGGESRVTVAKRYIHKDGHPVWARLTLSLLRASCGKPEQFIGVVEDVSPTRQAEEERERLFELSLDLLLVVDVDGLVEQINPAWSACLGWRKEDVVGTPWLDLFHPEDSEATSLVQEQLRGGEPVRNFESRYRGQDGAYRWLCWSAHPLAATRQIFAVARDITVRRISDERLRLLEMCLSRSKDIVIITKAEPIAAPGPEIVYVNDAFVRLTGFSREEALGQTPRILQGPKTDRAALGRLRASLEAWEPVRTELLNYTKSGEELWLELDIVPVPDSRGWFTHWVAVERDITDRKRAENKLAEQAALLDKAQDAIMVFDLDRRVLYWNRSAERLYGWTGMEVIGRTLPDFLCHDLGAFGPAMSLLVAHGEWTGEMEHRTKQGTLLTVEVRFTLVRDEDGRPSSVLAINTDVTERKRLEAQFLRAQRLDCIGTLAGGIAHDMNNLLTPILVSVAMLQEGEQDADRVEDVRTIETCAKRGAQMVQQLLGFARGGMDGKRTRIRLGTVIDEVAQIVRETFPKNITLRLDVPPKLYEVHADATQMHQLLTNLCVNARDAMPDGGTLSISAEGIVLDDVCGAALDIEAKRGPHVLLKVEDTGTGMPPETVERIFDPFFTTKELGHGTGLGLSTVHTIVRSHQGFVHVYSELGKGTRFEVHLPADPAAVVAAPADPPSSVAVRSPRGSGEVVLLVDDEETIRTVGRRILERSGYRVLSATNGAEAVSLFARHEHDVSVVVTDMMMPVMDGPATIVALKTLCPGVSIIASSGLDANKNLARAVDSGVKGFLPKPYTADAMLKLIHRVLHE